MIYKIGTRGSRLALIQADIVKQRLSEVCPQHQFELQIIKTRGDLETDRPLQSIGGKGLFVREIERQLLDGSIHLAVHSMKDLPVTCPAGICISQAWMREDPRDVLVLKEARSLEELPSGARIGTGSARRRQQLQQLRPDLELVGIRGNVDTRLKKLEEGELDGILLAAAGLHRLGLGDRITQYLEPEEMIPAATQGILAIEVREDEKELLGLLNQFADPKTEVQARAERSFLQTMQADCHMAVGAYCRQKGEGSYEFFGMYGNRKGTRRQSLCLKGENPIGLAVQAAEELRHSCSGAVQLVGSGPGARDLITLRGLQAIRQADCIIYDRLASLELLEEAPVHCEKIYAGKQSHDHTFSQQQIQKLLVQKALEYDRVIRLKGGDPYVFGRGGEEALYLRTHGIKFQVIPGISSCIAGPANGGIPITQRGMAVGFRVVTAHSQRDELADIDFESMARGKETCIFLMGLHSLEEIANRLQQAGMDPHIPAAVISQATCPDQRACYGEVGSLAAQVRQAGLESPAIIVVGQVVSLHSQLEEVGEGRENSLEGKTYLLPKIGCQPSRLAAMIEDQGGRIQEIPVGEIHTIPCQLTRECLGKMDWILFTSAHGVESFFENMENSGLDARSLAGSQVAVIGQKTRDRLETYGIRADLIPGKAHSQALLETLLPRLRPTDRVWYMGEQQVRNALTENLGNHCEFQVLGVYENREIPQVDFAWVEKLEICSGVLFTCASNAERFWELVSEVRKESEIRKWKEHLICYSIGPVTTRTLEQLGVCNIKEADCTTYEGMAACLM